MGVGRGSFGRVVEAVNVTTKPTIAIKVIKDVTSYIQELAIYDKIRSEDANTWLVVLMTISFCLFLPLLYDSCLNVLDSFHHGDMHCIVMEALGPSLWHMVHPRKDMRSFKFPRPAVKQVMKQILTGVSRV
jgi:serine/threonine protein kinase